MTPDAAPKIHVTMTRLLTFGVVVLSSLALAGKPAGKTVELNGDVAKGGETFKTLCASCHGAGGAGDGPASAALNPKPAKLNDPARAKEVTDEYVYKMIKEGGAANGKSALMVAWKTSLNEQQIVDVATFVRSLSKPPAKKK